MDDYETTLEQHRELREVVHDLRRIFLSPGASSPNAARPKEAEAKLLGFYHLLARHFRDEEAGGYMSGIAAEHPELERKIDSLLVQHAQMLADLREVVQASRDAAHAHELAAALRAMLTLFEEHERAENALIASVLCTDIGLGG